MNKSAPRKRLPVHPSLEHLQKQAKRLAKQAPGLQLAQAQHQLAQEYGCKKWAELARMVETMRRGGDQLVNVKIDFQPLAKAARKADIESIRQILQEGTFTQHDLDQGLAHALWYEENGTWNERRAVADLLLAHGADPDGQYGSNYGPIVFGTGECLHPAGLQYLIDAGADVTFPPIETKYGPQCPLSTVLGTYARGHNERKHRMIDMLLQNGAYIPPEVTPPILAIHRGDAQQLNEWLKQDSSLAKKQFPDMPYGNIELKGATLLHCAVEFGEMECLKLLFDTYHADINLKAAVINGIGGQTPVYHAINTSGDTQFHVLDYLVQRAGLWMDMSVRATWKNSGSGLQSKPMTPLEYAESAANEEARKWRKNVDQELSLLRSLDLREQIKAALLRKDTKAVERLLDEHPELLTPALWPVAIFQAKSPELTRLLLDRGLNPDECSAPRKPLHLAVYQCLPDIVELLIARGADVNLRNPLGETPLELLDAYEPRPVGDPDSQRIRRALLKAGAREDFLSVVRAGDLEQAEQQLEVNPKLATGDSELGGPLFVAARSGRHEIAALLLAFGSDPNKTNDKNNTALWFAAQSPAQPASNRIEVMKLLLDAGADIHCRCEGGSTALHFAAWRGPLPVVEFLLSRGATPGALDDKGKTPLDYVTEHGASADKEAIIQRLCLISSKEAVPESSPGQEASPDQQIIDSVLNNKLPALKRLLDTHPEKISLTGGQWNKPLLHCAAWEGHLPIVFELLKRGFDVTTRCESDHACAIHFAAERGHLDIVKTLAEAGADIEAPDNDHQLNVLGWATSMRTCQKHVADYLLSRGATMDIWSAISLNNAEALRKLFEANPHVLESRMSRNEYHRTALHHAVERNRPDMVKLLLELGADPDALDSLSLGPLGSGKADSHPEILRLLQNKSRKATLHDALVLGRFDEAETLLLRDPGCLQRGGSETRLFVYAVVRKNWAMAEWLVDHGTDINAVAEVYQCPATALHFLVEQGDLERIRWLLNLGADTTIRDGKYEADAGSWADFFGREDIGDLIKTVRQVPVNAKKLSG